MPSAEVQAVVGDYRGPLYELADEQPVGPQRLEGTGLWPPQDGLPTRLAHVTISSGSPGEGQWLKVTTRMLQPHRFREHQTAQFHLGAALLIEQVASGAAAEAQEKSDCRWSVARAAPAKSSSVLLDDERVSSSRLEADLASIGVETPQPVVVFAESIDLPDIEVIVWGHASAWPLPLQTVPQIQRYLAS